jgi:hypothetical protein
MQAVCVKAASSGSLSILTYMREHGAQWSAADLTQLLHSAAHRDCLYVAKWLRQQGAEWPDQLLGSDGCAEWGPFTVAWARRLGCTAPLTPSEQRALDAELLQAAAAAALAQPHDVAAVEPAATAVVAAAVTAAARRDSLQALGEISLAAVAVAAAVAFAAWLAPAS